MAATSKNFLKLMAIGDAFGMKYEFLDHAIPISAHDLTYGSRPGFLAYQQAHYTDDTQKSLGNAELLLRKWPGPITRSDFINAWMEVFHRDDPRPGYSKQMLKVLSNSRNTESFLENLEHSRRISGGAVMASAPFGLLPDLKAVKDLTRSQAAITHDTNTGINSALAVALSSHFLHHGGRIEYLEKFVAAHLGSNWCSPESGFTDNPENGLNIARQALNACKETSFSRVLIAGVSQNRVADTDTICAIAMALASRRNDIVDDLPSVLRSDLEKGKYGLEYLEETDSHLAQKFPRTNRLAAFTP